MSNKKKSLAERQAEMKAVLKAPKASRQKKPYRPQKMTPKQIAFVALKQQGLNNSQIEKVSGITRGYGAFLEKRLEGRYDLRSNIMVKHAHRAIKSTLKMQPIEVEKINIINGIERTVKEKVYPSHTNRLTAATMVMDRDQPVIQHIQSKTLLINISDATVQAMLQALGDSSGLLPDAQEER